MRNASREACTFSCSERRGLGVCTRNRDKGLTPEELRWQHSGDKQQGHRNAKNDTGSVNPSIPREREGRDTGDQL